MPKKTKTEEIINKTIFINALAPVKKEEPERVDFLSWLAKNHLKIYVEQKEDHFYTARLFGTSGHQDAYYYNDLHPDKLTQPARHGFYSAKASIMALAKDGISKDAECYWASSTPGIGNDKYILGNDLPKFRKFFGLLKMNIRKIKHPDIKTFPFFDLKKLEKDLDTYLKI